MVCAEAPGFVFFTHGAAQNRDFRTQSMRILDRQVAESAHPQNGYFFAGTSVPMLQWGIRGDAGAEQRARLAQLQAVRDPDYESFRNDDLLAVSAVSWITIII